MANCKLCQLETARFARAHVIPRSFYDLGQANDLKGPMKIISSERSIRPTRSRTGEYDERLLCPECEASFSDYDGYAHRLLYRTDPTSVTRDAGEDLAYTYGNLDKDRLTVFFIALMWRMHSSSRPAFKSVNLGGLEPKFRVSALNKEPNGVPELDVVIQKFDQTTGIIFPTRLSFGGLAGYRVCFSGYSCWVKIDSKPIGDPFDEVALSSGPSLHVLLTDYLTSPERVAARRLVRRHLL